MSVPCGRPQDCARCGHMPELHAEGGRCMAVWSVAAGSVALHECPCPCFETFEVFEGNQVFNAMGLDGPGVKPFDHEPDDVHTPARGGEKYTLAQWLWAWSHRPLFVVAPIELVALFAFLLLLWLGA